MARTRHLPDTVYALLLVVAVSAPAATAAAETRPSVRVVNATPIVRWFPYVKADILATVEPGTTLEVLDKEGSWYWVIMPRDAHGSRRPGWVAASNVEAVADRLANLTPEPGRRDETGTSISTVAPSATIPASNAGRPSVVITVGEEKTASNSTNVQAPRKEYSFEDVHFARNQYALRPEEMTTLDGAVNALKEDPLLRLSLEGYTCNLGTAAYNLVLGDRRANVVKDYLVGKGVPADRLRPVSFGKERPKHDNSSEETRRLNRRVALVPDVQP